MPGRSFARYLLYSASTAIKGDLLAKPNYQFEKRQKELAKKNKKEEKRQKKVVDNTATDDVSQETPSRTMPAAIPAVG
jgi:hypothetical protein